MGLLQRLRRITMARIESFLSTAEDPELLFPQLVREMEEQVRQATEAEAKAMAMVKAAEREAEQVGGRIERMKKGAELALAKGDEATAREALSAQINLEAESVRKVAAVPKARAIYEEAREARKQIQSELEELRVKKDEMLSRARINKTQKRVQRTVHGPAGSSRSILDSVAQLETKVEESEAEIAVQGEMTKGTGGGAKLEKRLQDLEKSASVEDRLAALKQRVGGTRQSS